jgi:hypothetical protein
MEGRIEPTLGPPLSDDDLVLYARTLELLRELYRCQSTSNVCSIAEQKILARSNPNPSPFPSTMNMATQPPQEYKQSMGDTTSMAVFSPPSSRSYLAPDSDKSLVVLSQRPESNIWGSWSSKAISAASWSAVFPDASSAFISTPTTWRR